MNPIELLLSAGPTVARRQQVIERLLRKALADYFIIHNAVAD